jgi:hypothetical protein
MESNVYDIGLRCGCHGGHSDSELQVPIKRFSSQQGCRDYLDDEFVLSPQVTGLIRDFAISTTENYVGTL